MKWLYSILILTLSISACKPHALLQVYTANLYPVSDTTLTIDPSYEKLINPYAKGLEAEMNRIIGFSPAFMIKSQPSSMLGNFMADAVFDQSLGLASTPDFSLANYGGIRSTVDSGDITVGDMFELMPFENEIVLVELTYNQVDTLKQFIKAKGGEPFSKHLLNLPKKETYWIATNNYIANGGDNYAILTRSKNRIDTGIKLRDALIAYVEKHKVIPTSNQERVL